MNRESATFQLATSASGSSFIKGTSSFTWLNFNLREALGTMWYKYDRLKLYCTQVVYTTGTSTNESRSLNFFISGLNLEYETYNNSNNKKTNEAFMTSIFQSFANTNAVKTYPSYTGIVFKKDEEIVNLTITVKSGYSGTSPTVSFAGATFIFQIIVYGIEEIPRTIKNINPKTYPLVLSGYQATSQNANKTRMVFSNINLRDVIGIDYDKYDRFKIILLNYVMNNQSNGGTNAFSILMEGLPFENATYTIANGASNNNPNALSMGKTNYWTLASTWYTTNYTVPIFPYDYMGAVFGKFQDRVNLILSLVYMTGTVLRPENYANSTFYFYIVPIEE